MVTVKNVMCVRALSALEENFKGLHPQIREERTRLSRAKWVTVFLWKDTAPCQMRFCRDPILG